MDVRPKPRWFKSSYSGGSGTECVECRHDDGHLKVRDSKSTDGPVVAVRPDAWRAFIRTL
ncbi:DUF397 domain-containing protein [Streptomyces sp. NPDC006285]|uniref:DUF397 domain-containing protein n=1 Tax=Streptomyces sp. NPDC006285 TaxID=3364742 RepID=UPI00367B8460